MIIVGNDEETWVADYFSNDFNILMKATFLTHWGHVTHICISKLIIIGSDNGLSLGCHQAIIWTNAVILSTEPLGTNFIEIWIKIESFSFRKMHFKLSSAKWRPFCFGLNVLTVSMTNSRMQFTAGTSPHIQSQSINKWIIPQCLVNVMCTVWDLSPVNVWDGGH